MQINALESTANSAKSETGSGSGSGVGAGGTRIGCTRRGRRRLAKPRTDAAFLELHPLWTDTERAVKRCIDLGAAPQGGCHVRSHTTPGGVGAGTGKASPTSPAAAEEEELTFDLGVELLSFEEPLFEYKRRKKGAAWKDDGIEMGETELPSVPIKRTTRKTAETNDRHSPPSSPTAQNVPAYDQFGREVSLETHPLSCWARCRNYTCDYDPNNQMHEYSAVPTGEAFPTFAVTLTLLSNTKTSSNPNANPNHKPKFPKSNPNPKADPDPNPKPAPDPDPDPDPDRSPDPDPNPNPNPNSNPNPNPDPTRGGVSYLCPGRLC